MYYICLLVLCVHCVDSLSHLDDTVVISRCTDCSDERTDFVCGTDQRTYQNQCHLTCQSSNLASSGTDQLEVKHHGRCQSNNNSCRAQRSLALQQGLAAGLTVVPECMDNGMFKTIQCHKASGYCWCVGQVDGKPVPGSSLRHRKPNCDELTKRRSHRRSARKGQNRSRTPGIRACSAPDRVQFAFNLLALFKSEFTRTQQVNLDKNVDTQRPGHKRDMPQNKPDRKVINWKFTQLDTNADRLLRKAELRDLKRMIKKIVQPRTCAKMFVRTLDMDKDEIISKREWNNYFRVLSEGVAGVESNRRFEVHSRPRGNGGRNSNRDEQKPDHGEGSDDEEEEYDERKLRLNPMDFLSSIQSASVGLNPSSVGGGGIPFLSEGSKDDEEEEEEEEDEEITISTQKDCPSSRAVALKNPAAKSFVPECNDKGTYREIQCHENFCWCVDPTLGTPMRGTSPAAAGSRPDCTNRMAVRPQASPASGSLPKQRQDCSAQKRARFLELLVDAFQFEMSNSGLRGGRTSTRNEATRWKFESADADGSGFLEKREWKPFRLALRDVPKGDSPSSGRVITKMRKCFRNFLKSCDTNSDKQIELEEWYQCTGSSIPVDSDVKEIKREPTLGNAGAERNSKRRGPNPFSTILKAD